MDYLEIKGDQHPFWFAIKAQREMTKCKDLDQKDDIYFIYLGLKYGSKKEGKTFPYSEEALEDIFEDDMDAYSKACELLGEQWGNLKKNKDKALKGLQ